MSTRRDRDQMGKKSGLGALLASVALASLVGAGTAGATPKALERYASSLADVPSKLEREGSVYVPSYSLLPHGGGKTSVSFSVTLSIRNLSSSHVIALRRIAYYDTAGVLLENYVAEPVGIRPYGAVNFFVPVVDGRGGEGGNFVIDWAAEAGAPDLLVEAIMLGNIGGSSYAFTSRGVEIGKR